MTKYLVSTKNTPERFEISADKYTVDNIGVHFYNVRSGHGVSGTKPVAFIADVATILDSSATAPSPAA